MTERDPYCTQDDIELRYPQAIAAAGPRDDEGEIDEEAIFQATIWASDLIDTYVSLNGRYSIPFSSPPEWVVDIAVDLSLYRITPAVVLESFKDRYTRYDHALQYLAQVRDGKISPPTEPAIPGAVETLTGGIFNTGRRDFDGVW